ncbi:MAG: hypothetical protein CMP81_04440 [Fulvimarina sp.]|nr:hypothetical protein [Fulvimarina sp.]
MTMFQRTGSALVRALMRVLEGFRRTGRRGHPLWIDTAPDSLLRDIGLKDGRGSSPERIDKPG